MNFLIHNGTLTALLGELPVGEARIREAIHPLTNEQILIVDHLEVYQKRKGYGKAIMDHLKQYKMPIILEVQDTNTIAKDFYKAQGFKPKAFILCYSS